MEIDKDIDNMLNQIYLEPQIIRNLVEEFIWDVMCTQDGVNIPIGIEQYRQCLLDNKEAFVAFMSREQVGFIDELTIRHLWDYREFLDRTLKPQDEVNYLIACRLFLTYCYREQRLDLEIADNMQLDNNNDYYVAESDPMAFDMLDIL
jgi:hypothetical protein